MKLAFAAAAVLAAGPTLAPSTASAQVDSIRLGVMKHNICISDCKNADKEDGPNIDGELRFVSPSFLKVIWSPHPYIMASGNVAGKTSFAGAGLEYDWNFTRSWHFEPGFGIIVHDGSLNNPYPPTSTQAHTFSDNNVLLGSRALFRTNLALTYDLNDRWGVQAIYEHLSHGQILGHGRNQGLDELGGRIVWRFK